jgi:hypothetical protein
MMERRLRISAVSLVLGLLVELFTLFSARPFIFLVYVGFGGLLIAVGVLLYLWTLLQSLVPRAKEPLI